MTTASFPRQHARTRRYTLGVPRGFVPGRDERGPFVLFLRTDTGDDPVTHLWRYDVDSDATSKLVDARSFGVDGEDLPPEERARRERAREQAGGIVAFATDRDARMAAFVLGAKLLTVEVATGAVAVHPTAGPAFDPRPAPDGTAVAYHARNGLHLVTLPDGPAAPGRTRPLVEPGTKTSGLPAVVDDTTISWGRAEFVAAEEMGRSRGFWWSSDSRRLAIARVDEAGVAPWTIADPAEPAAPAVTHRYPAAGTTNAAVSLWVVEVPVDDGASGPAPRLVPVTLPPAPDGEYLAAVSWGSDPLTVTTQHRNQRQVEIRTVADDGSTEMVHRIVDDTWVELIPGTPTWAGTTLVTVEDRPEGPGGTRRLCLGGDPVTPPGLQVREVVHADKTLVVFLASGDDPTQVHTYRLQLDGDVPDLMCLTDDEPGVHREIVAGSSLPSVRVSSGLDRPTPRVRVHRRAADGDDAGASPLDVVAATPVLQARPRLLELGDRALRAALLLPEDDDGTAALPVLLDPYGGPHAQRVLHANAAFLTSQWFANLGMAVLVVDGRGTPGRGPQWERAVAGDLLGPVLEDQLDALDAAARLEPRLDLDRVAIRGWSFGGTLAATAALRAPDRFRAAIAGAPVTDWALYDTHYTERYLGHPRTDPEAYRRSSLVGVDGELLDAASAGDKDPSLLLIHGLADDNVVAAHSLRLSSALLAAGRQHEFLPLSGVTHMTPQEVVAEQLLVWQARCLRQALMIGPTA